MSEEFLAPFDHGPIPKDLWSDFEEGPFQSCTVCGKPLSGLYEIQKVRNERETILEMACCMECGQSLIGEYSVQSLTSIREFLAKHLNLTRQPELCAICGAPYRRTETASSSAICADKRLILPVIHVCSSCEESIEALLSEQTRRAHGDFINRTFPGVPANLDLAPKILF